MDGEDVLKFSLKHIQKVQTLPAKTSAKLSREGEGNFDSELLFQRSVFGKCL